MILHFTINMYNHFFFVFHSVAAELLSAMLLYNCSEI